MKALLQRVSRASVSVDGRVVGSIDRGLVALIGVHASDTEDDAKYLAQKTTALRIFPDTEGKFNLSASDIKGELLIVSQFTLLADTRKGRRPSFTEAAPPAQAEKLFNEFVAAVGATGLKVATGRFQARMTVEILSDGPVTIMLDSKERLNAKVEAPDQ